MQPIADFGHLLFLDCAAAAALSLTIASLKASKENEDDYVSVGVAVGTCLLALLILFSWSNFPFDPTQACVATVLWVAITQASVVASRQLRFVPLLGLATYLILGLIAYGFISHLPTIPKTGIIPEPNTTEAHRLIVTSLALTWLIVPGGMAVVRSLVAFTATNEDESELAPSIRRTESAMGCMERLIATAVFANSQGPERMELNISAVSLIVAYLFIHIRVYGRDESENTRYRRGLATVANVIIGCLCAQAFNPRFFG